MKCVLVRYLDLYLIEWRSNVVPVFKQHAAKTLVLGVSGELHVAATLSPGKKPVSTHWIKCCVDWKAGMKAEAWLGICAP
jgi:hypothetical protein